MRNAMPWKPNSGKIIYSNNRNTMKDLRFRTLNADEIGVRVQSAKNGITRLLTYIDSRSAILLLNETVGAYNWQTDFKEVNGLVICSLSLWDEDKQAWVSKADTGSESAIEAQKGLISDAYKRCLSRWGVTCLYSAPVIELPGENKWEKYRVTNIDYDGEYADSHITKLTIVDSKGRKVFDWNLKDGITYKTEEPSEYNPNSKPPVKKDSKPTYKLTTVDELHEFCNARVKEVGGELRKPIVEFAKTFGEKVETMLPINNGMAFFMKWLEKENNPVIKDNIDTFRTLWKK